jgi:hypothetical protein
MPDENPRLAMRVISFRDAGHQEENSICRAALGIDRLARSKS